MSGKPQKLIAVIVCVICLMSNVLNVLALDNTTYTYTVSVDDNWVKTQDAYMPATVYLKGEGLAHPEDLFVFENKLYIADTDNHRIAVFSLADEKLDFFGEDVLSAPRGIYITADGTVYIADSGAQAILIFSSDYKLIKKIEKPDSYLFSENSSFKPKGVAVSSSGNIFVVSEGTYEGIMQFDLKGEFFGYFAANTYKMSFSERIEDLLLNETQKNQLFVRTPRPIENIDISDEDLIYSITRSEEIGTSVSTVSGNGLKMHNMAGINIFASNKDMKDEWNFVDVASGNYGNVFALTDTGLITEYDSSGNVIFSFAGRALENDRSGLFTNAAAIDVDKSTGFVYVLDKERALVQVFYPTDYANYTHEAIKTLESGDYKSSEKIWSDLIRLNSMSQIAHIGYGKSLYYQQKYNEALEHFKIANDVSYYSEAKWELRNVALNRNMPIIICVFLVLLIIFSWKNSRRKKNGGKRLKPFYEPQLYNKGKLSNAVMKVWFSRKMLRHPIDGNYYLQRGQTGSLISASVLYILTFAVYMADFLCRGFIFRMTGSATSLQSLIILFWVPLVLWLAGTYMIGTINDGEASFANIYIGTAYALTPYLYITPFTIALTHLLTLNESFIITLFASTAIVWSAALLVLSVKEMQKYSFSETVKNILLVIFFMIMVVVSVVIIYLLLVSLFDFFREIMEEGVYRVEN